MAGEKLSELTNEATTVNAVDRLYIEQGGESKFLTGSTLSGLAAGAQFLVWNPLNNQLTISGGNTVHLAPLSVTITGAESIVSIPDGFLLEKAVFVPNGDQTVTLGTTSGGSEIFSEDLTDGEPMVIIFDFYANGATNVYLNGTDCLVKLYFR